MASFTRCLIQAQTFRIVLSAAVLAALALTMSGCAGRGRLERNSNWPGGELPLAAPAQMLDLLDARGSSAAGQTKAGAEYETGLANDNVVFNGSALDFAPAWNTAGSPQFSDLAYAIYLFDGTGMSGSNTLTSIFTAPPAAADFWVGLANFSTQRWDWFQPGVTGPLAIASVAPYIDPADSRMLAAYVMTGTAVCTLDTVTLGEYIPEIPLPVVPLAQLPMGGGGLAGPVMADGNPALAFIEDNGGMPRLIFIRATNSEGSAWNDPVVIAENITGTPGLQVIGGNPAVTYQGDPSGNLMYCRADDAQGTVWGTPVSVDSTTLGAGLNSELQDIAGRPAVVYLASGMDNYSQPALYIRADDALGSAWSDTPVELNPEYVTGEQARYMSFAVIDSNPAVAYNWVGEFSAGVRYVRATDLLGSAWTAPVPIPGTGYEPLTMLRNIDLADLGGLPGVAYFMEDFGVPANSAVYFADAQDAAGSAWDELQIAFIAPAGEDPVNFGSLQAITKLDGTQRAILVATRDGSVVNDRADIFVATIPPLGGADFSAGTRHMIARFQQNKSPSALKAASCFDSVDTIGMLFTLALVGGSEYLQLVAAMQGYDFATDSMGVATTYGVVPADNF